MPLAKGTVLEDRYRIDAQLGAGGMGAVYRAWDLRLDRYVALKENALAHADSARQFESEAKVMARLKHPNLPRVSDHFVTADGIQYLVMDYVEGEDLGQMSKRVGPLSEQQALAWIAQVCDALTYLHNQEPPIIHRDVKPSNIKITPQGQVFLVDFGIAKVGDARQLTMAGARGVTPGFSPPEQYGAGGTDVPSDIYAVGATFYALVTGQTPPDSVQRAIRAATLTPADRLRPDLSPNVAAALEAALKTDPADRPQTVVQFQTLLGGAQAKPEPVPPGSVRKPLPGWVWAAVAGGILVVILGLALVMLGGGDDSAQVLPSHTPVPTAALVSSPAETAGPLATFTPVDSSIATLEATTAPEPTVTHSPEQATPTSILLSTPTPVPTFSAINAPTPTATPRPAAPTPTAVPVHTPTSIPTLEATPTHEPAVAYQPIPLGAAANGASDFLSPPVGSITLSGLPFQLSDRVFRSQASPAPNNSYPTAVSLPIDAPQAFRVHMLLTVGNGFSQFNGSIVGRVVAYCNGAAIPLTDLVLGRDVREWHVAENVVSSASRARQVWSGAIANFPNLDGHIDLLSLDLPVACRDGRLTALELVDSSSNTVGSLDPAFNLHGVTVETRQ